METIGGVGEPGVERRLGRRALKWVRGVRVGHWGVAGGADALVIFTAMDRPC